MVKTINNFEEFNQFLKDNEKVVVDCYASWCGPCKMLGPIIDEASANRQNVAFAKVDIDAIEEVPEKFQITSIPTVLFFKNGNLVHEFLGYIPLNDVLKHVDEAFKA